MNRKSAREVAEKITNEQLQTMFDNAKKGVEDWKKVSRVNKGFTKGCAWNILAEDFDIGNEYHIIAKTNMIREFGEFLPEELKPLPKKKRILPPPVHYEPKFKQYVRKRNV